MYSDLYASGLFETMNLQTDEDEHSIEMHLPYIAKVMERSVTYTLDALSSNNLLSLFYIGGSTVTFRSAEALLYGSDLMSIPGETFFI